MSEDTRDYLTRQGDYFRQLHNREPTLDDHTRDFALISAPDRARILDTLDNESKNETIDDNSGSLRAAGKRARLVQQLHHVHRTLVRVNR
jgi:hypothetical protein